MYKTMCKFLNCWRFYAAHCRDKNQQTVKFDFVEAERRKKVMELNNNKT